MTSDIASYIAFIVTGALIGWILAYRGDKGDL